MAKKRKSRKSRKSPAAPSVVTRTLYRSRPAARVRAAASGAASRVKAAAKENKHILAGLGGALLLGFVEAKGFDEKLPKLPVLGTAGTIGLVAAVGGHYMKNDVVKHIGLGALSVAAYRLGVQAAGGSPAGVSGDIGAAPAAAMLNPPPSGITPAQFAMLQAMQQAATQSVEGDEDEIEGDEDEIEGDEDED